MGWLEACADELELAADICWSPEAASLPLAVVSGGLLAAAVDWAQQVRGCCSICCNGE